MESWLFEYLYIEWNYFEPKMLFLKMKMNNNNQETTIKKQA